MAEASRPSQIKGMAFLSARLMLTSYWSDWSNVFLCILGKVCRS